MKRTVHHKVNKMNFLLFWELQKAKRRLRDFWEDEEGIGTVELVLILVVLVGLVAIFKDKLQQLINSIFSKITSNANSL